MRALNSLVLILVIVGAVNWGLVGLFNLDLVKLITTGNGAVPAGYSNIAGRIIYLLVALAGLVAFNIFGLFNDRNERLDRTV